MTDDDMEMTRRVMVAGGIVGAVMGIITGSFWDMGKKSERLEYSDTFRTQHAEVEVKAREYGENSLVSSIEAEMINTGDGLQFAVVKLVFGDRAENLVWKPGVGFYGDVLANVEPDSATFTTVAGGETQHQTAVYMSTNE